MYYVLTRDDSILIGITTYNPYTFNLPNISIHEMDGVIPDLNQYTWDFALGDFIRSGNTYSRREFLTKFTLSERASIRASTDPIVIDIRNMLEIAEYVDITSSDTVQSIGYLASVGLIAPNRLQEILS